MSPGKIVTVASICICCSVGASVSVTFLLAPRQEHQSSSGDGDAHLAVERAAERIAQMERRLAAFNGRLDSAASLESVRALQLQVDSLGLRTAPVAASPTPDSPLDRKKDENLRKNEVLQRQRMDDALYGEERDQKWAQKSEDILLRVLHQEASASVRALETICQSTMCKMKLLVNDAAEIEKLDVLVSSSVPWSHSSFVEVRMDEGRGERVATFYISREGYSLPST